VLRGDGTKIRAAVVTKGDLMEANGNGLASLMSDLGWQNTSSLASINQAVSLVS
jgi:hypothetical protein